MSKRKIVNVEATDHYVSFGDFDGKTPEQIIQFMLDLRAKVGDRDVYFDIDYYGYDGGKDLFLRERRLENDEEYNQRLAEEKKLREIEKKKKADKEAKELAEYERLRKKFEK